MASQSRHFPPYPDYTPELANKVLNNKTLKKELEDKLESIIATLYADIEEFSTEPTTDTSVYTGSSGIAFMNYFLFKKTREQKYLDVAMSLTENALKGLRGRRISFLNGDAGPIALSVVLNVMDNNGSIASSHLKMLIQLGNQEDSSLPDEILYGRAGYLYALLFVDQETHPMVPEKVLRKHVEKILQSGSQLSQKRKSSIPLEYEWHDKAYLGAAHGYAGILYLLLISSRYMTEYELDSLVRPTLDWLISTRFPSNNFPSSVDSETDRLVQWCHGSPGFTLLLSLAGQVFNNPRYKELALQCGDVIWDRGLLKKGYSICHGVTGNAYTFLHLYQMTHDEKHLYRVASYVDWCTRYPFNEGMKPDRPFSLFEGKAGLLCFLVDVKDPLSASFPCYELKLSV